MICDADKLTDKGCTGAPDWIIDPEKNRIILYLFESDDAQEYTFLDSVKAGIYEDLTIDFRSINI